MSDQAPRLVGPGDNDPLGEGAGPGERAPGQLALSEHRGEGTLVLELAGELDLATAGLMREALERMQLEQPELVVIDLSGLSFIDSTGIRVIVSAYQRLQDAPRPRLEIRPGNRAIQRVFQITGLDRVLPFAAP